MNDIVSIFTYTLNEDSVGDYLVSPVVAYFCFDSVDFNFEKADVLEEDIFSDIKKEKKALRRGKTSELTGTVYKLSPEQKRALKMLKKKYGRSLIKEIKSYRKRTLAPYQVAKSYMEKSKALYPKEVYGMTKEDYLRYKKSAEEKIKNLRSNRYYDLSREISGYADKRDRIEDLDDFMTQNLPPNDAALNRVFKKYGLYSYRYTDAEMNSIRKKIDNVDKVRRELYAKIASSTEISREDAEKLKKAIESVKTAKKELSEKETDTERNLKELRGISKKIKDTDGLTEKLKDSLQDIIDGMEDLDVKITSSSFEKEFENFLIREKIREDIRNHKNNKYTDDYRHAIQDIKDNLDQKKRDTLAKMAKERESKTFNDYERKIYEIKPGRPKDSDRLSDYVLKIKEEDFFEPKFYSKSEEFKEAERKIDAEIKRFERALEAKMSKEDYQLLKKYRLISNLITIKDAKLSDVYKEKKED